MEETTNAVENYNNNNIWMLFHINDIQETDVWSSICFIHIFFWNGLPEENYDNLILDVGWTQKVLEPYDQRKSNKNNHQGRFNW